MPAHLDGNALAGPLSELFAFDITTASVCCTACADVAALAVAMVYASPMGWVMRCRVCGSVLLVVVHARSRYSVMPRGMSWAH